MKPLTDKEKKNIRKAIMGHTRDEKPVTRMQWKRISVAAAIIALILVPFFLFVPVKSSRMHAELTGALQTRQVMLPDGSQIVLNGNSSITYSNTFSSGGARDVYLRGNAFFKIKKDRAFRPFTVHANALTVTVLGTEFNVNARSAATDVSLITGRVKIEKPGNENSTLLLSPGERVREDSLGTSFTRSRFNPDMYSAWTDGRWVFHKTSLQEITTLIEAYYGTPAIFSDKKIRQLQMTAMIPVGTLQDLIPVINETLGLTITLSNNKLFIQ